MVKFKPYDKIRRIGKDWDEVENSKTYIVASIMNDWAIRLGGLEGGYDSQHFEFIEAPVAYDKDNAPLYEGDLVVRLARGSTERYEGRVCKDQRPWSCDGEEKVRISALGRSVYSLTPERKLIELKTRKEDLTPELKWTDVTPGKTVTFKAKSGEIVGPVKATRVSYSDKTLVLGRKVDKWEEHGVLISIDDEDVKEKLPNTPDSKIRRDGIDYVLDALGCWHSLRDGRIYAKSYFANGYWTLVRDAATVES